MPFRLVIQYVGDQDSSHGHYVALVYPGPKNSPFQSARIPTREELMRRLRVAIPGFNEELLPKKEDGTQIVFADSMELSDAQLSGLGLR